MTFHERGRMLKELALHLRKHLDKFYSISYKTGATKADSWVDIEGGLEIFLPMLLYEENFLMKLFVLMARSHNLSKNNTFMGTHILVPKEGVAIHINAFNFPVWGMLEKSCGKSFSRNAGNCKTGNDHFLFNGSSSKRNYCK
jgi:oxepin-CoA hydrolase/3-oxo-5,6-dehydrosuberyl-CoA semialdehyde dehydrogenase